MGAARRGTCHVESVAESAFPRGSFPQVGCFRSPTAGGPSDRHALTHRSGQNAERTVAEMLIGLFQALRQPSHLTW